MDENLRQQLIQQISDARAGLDRTLALLSNTPNEPHPLTLPTIVNGDFSDRAWVDIPAGYTRNQKPNGWELSWLKPGAPLYSAQHDLAEVEPECVHKLASQLPPDEQLGAANALILAGDATYKIFHGYGAFGAELRQIIYAPANSHGIVVVPIQVHVNDARDPWRCEAGLWVNGVGAWHNLDVINVRKWFEMRSRFDIEIAAPIEILIRVKCKGGGADFFLDNVRVEAI